MQNEPAKPNPTDHGAVQRPPSRPVPQPDGTNAVLLAREDLTELLSIVRVRDDVGRVPEFMPGQFVRLGVPKLVDTGGAAATASSNAAATSANAATASGSTAPPPPLAGAPAPAPRAGRAGRVRLTRRAYSIASSPLVRDYLEFFVVRIDTGELTPRLWAIEPGGRLWMDEIAKGEFTLDHAPPGKDLVMISTGTGIAPFMSMLRTYRNQGRWRRFILIHGARYAADLGYRAEMEQIVREDPTVCYIPLVTREPEPPLPGAPEHGVWTGLRGRVQSALEHELYCKLVGAPLDPVECHVFLCGNPQMIDEVEALLTSRGFVTDSREQAGNIHFERYW